MNTERRHLLGAIGSGVALAAVGLAVLAYPSWREQSRILRETASLRSRMEGSSATVEIEARLRAELEVERAAIETDCRPIPEEPGTAQLMRRLSMPVDDRTVADQTFTVGIPYRAVPTQDWGEMIVPLTIGMVADFDSIFAVVRAAERSDALVRVASLRIDANGKSDPRDASTRWLDASIGLEVAYLPGSGREERP